MTIIEEMRANAKACREFPAMNDIPESIAKDMDRWADWLEKSGALVPTPMGATCGYEEWLYSESRMAQMNGVLIVGDDLGYCTNAVTDEIIDLPKEDDDGNWDEPTVQPVKWVPITEAMP